MIVAGEASGDLHGSGLVAAMKAQAPSLRFYGVGGKKMREAGVDLIADSADMAVVGVTEVVSRLGFIMKVMSLLKKALREKEPALVILIDYPDFNLSLAKAAKKRGIKIFYYISPTVWAWRRGRIKTIRRVVDTMAVILPFEAAVYREAGVDATFVGHPLLDVVERKYTPEEARRRFGLKEGFTTVGILPGSRRSEVSRHLPEMLGAAEIMAKEIPRLQFILPLAPTLEEEFVLSIIRRHVPEVKVIRSDTYDAIGICDAAVVASGTATLETALLEVPMIVIYRVSLPSYLIGRVLIHIDHISLVNIIAGKSVVPELIQGEANAKNMAAEVMKILADGESREEMKRELRKIRDLLGAPGAAARAAGLALRMFDH